MKVNKTHLHALFEKIQVAYYTIKVCCGKSNVCLINFFFIYTKYKLYRNLI